jgi:hypothetical protein
LNCIIIQCTGLCDDCDKLLILHMSFCVISVSSSEIISSRCSLKCSYEQTNGVWGSYFLEKQPKRSVKIGADILYVSVEAILCMS